MTTAEIPRPPIHGVEVSEGHVVFNIGQVAVQEPKPAVIVPKTVTAPIEIDHEPVVYREPSIKQKFIDYMNTAWLREFDSKNGTTLYQEHKERVLANKILVARQAAGLDKPPVWSRNRVALKIAQRALEG